MDKARQGGLSKQVPDVPLYKALVHSAYVLCDCGQGKTKRAFQTGARCTPILCAYAFCTLLVNVGKASQIDLFKPVLWLTNVPGKDNQEQTFT